MSQQTTTYELADTGARFLALIVDGIIQGVILGILTRLLGGPGGGFLSFLIGLGYCWYFWTRYGGQTPGKMLMKIRVVKKNGLPMTDADAIIRYIGYAINSAVIMIGWLWALWDPERQGWHDKLVNTVVVRAS